MNAPDTPEKPPDTLLDATIPVGPPLPPPQTANGFSTGLFGTGLTLSLPPQDLTRDVLVSSAPQTVADGRNFPMLGGITLLAKLGQGGMGAVYYGVHPRLKKEVAVKVLPFHLAEQQPAMVERFFREAQIAAKVQSPHLVSVTDVNQEGGLAYLIMEFISGQSAGSYLKQCRDNEQNIPETIALDICIAATEGLAAAHMEGIIHRDVKPDNIMLPKVKGTDQLKFKSALLADLGLARSDDMAQSLTGTQTAMGTPGFMAPEQAKDAKSCGKPADVFSMGATLYALLRGEAPFTGDALMTILLDTMQKPHPPLTQFRKDVSKATLEVIEICLMKFPNKRFADAVALLEALKICRVALDQLGRDPGAADQAVRDVKQVLAKARSQKPAEVKAPAAAAPVAAPANDDPWAHTKVGRAPPIPAAARGAPAPVPHTVRKPSGGGKFVVLGILGLVLVAYGVYAIGRGADSSQASAPPGPTAPASAPPASARPVTAPPSSTPAAPPTVQSSQPTPAVTPPPGVKTPKDAGKPLVVSLDGNVKLEFVYVPGGQLQLVNNDFTPATDGLRKIRSFYIGKYHVTVAQFRIFINKTHYKTDAETSGGGWNLADQKWKKDVKGLTWQNPGFTPYGDDHPVVMVSMNDAEAFCKWAAETTGEDIFLTSLLEYDYAARGSTLQRYPWGNEWDGKLINHADLSLKKSGKAPADLPYDNDADDGYPFTSPVGLYKNASWCGAYDMIGNAWQWVSHPSPPARGHRMGGSWYSIVSKCSVNDHQKVPPEEATAVCGFRVALRPKAK